MRWRYVPEAVRDPLGFPKLLPEFSASSAALAVVLLVVGGTAPRILRWAGGSPSPTSTGSEFDTAKPVY
jgi:hypothetical protein